MPSLLRAIPEEQEPGADWSALPAIVAALASRAGRHDEDGSFPFENFPLLHKHGFLNLVIPRRYGGAGGGLLDALRALQEIGRGDAATGLVVAMHYNAHGNLARHCDWPQDIYERVVRSSIEGVALINGLAAEPILGAPARGGQFQTVAAEEREGWRIDGHKFCCTGSAGLTWMTVSAKTQDGKFNGSWLVPADAPGVRIIEGSWNQTGMRATASNEVVFENVFVPKNHCLGLWDPTISYGKSQQSGAWFALTISAVYLGAARAAQDFLLDYVKKRTPTSLGAPLSELPRIRERVGQVEILLRGAERLLRGIAGDYDRNETITANDVGVVKQIVRENTIEATELAIQTIGGPGFDKKYPIERHLRDVLVSRAHGPQFDSSCLGLANELLGPIERKV